MKTVFVYYKDNLTPQTFKNVTHTQLWTPSHGMETLVIYQNKITTHILRKHVHKYAIHDDE